MTDWKHAAQSLWGDDWIAPLSEFLGVNRRTIERWLKGQGEPSERLQDGLRQLSRRAGSDARKAGVILRRLCNGETPQDIMGEIASMRRALIKIDHEADLLTSLRRGDWPPSAP